MHVKICWRCILNYILIYIHIIHILYLIDIHIDRYMHFCMSICRQLDALERLKNMMMRKRKMTRQRANAAYNDNMHKGNYAGST